MENLVEKIAVEELAEEALPQERPLPESPLVVSYGMGVDSTAVLVGLHQRGVRPDLDAGIVQDAISDAAEADYTGEPLEFASATVRGEGLITTTNEEG